MKALSTAATGMMAQQRNVEVIANNIANMNTTGFKRSRAEFQDLLYQNISRVGANSSDAGTVVPSGVQIGVGVRTAGVYRITDQGALQQTGNDYDIAINGKGLFQITMPDGSIAYTRAGSFQLDPTGQLVNTEGFLLEPAISIPNEAIDVSINAQGEVQAILAGQTAPSSVGQITIAKFPNEAGLESIGGNLMLETQASGAPNVGTPASTGFGQLLQGALENSNVNAVSEITNLITAQRGYELNSKVIKTADEMLSSANRMR